MIHHGVGTLFQIAHCGFYLDFETSAIDGLAAVRSDQCLRLEYLKILNQDGVLVHVFRQQPEQASLIRSIIDINTAGFPNIETRLINSQAMQPLTTQKIRAMQQGDSKGHNHL